MGAKVLGAGATVVVTGVTDRLGTTVVATGMTASVGETGVVARIVSAGVVGVAVESAMAARVFGPTAPYPVVAGVPEETIPCRVWNLSTAASVSGPK